MGTAIAQYENACHSPALIPRTIAFQIQTIGGRHPPGSFVITSNRSVEEWLSLFDDPILGSSALDRLANASFQIVIEGASYREKLWPHRKLLGDRGSDLPSSHNLIKV